MLSFKLKHFPEAIVVLEDLLKKDPELTPIYRDLGFAYLMNEEEQKSIAAFKNYLKYFPNSKERDEIKQFIKSLEEQKKAEAPLEPVIGEKWSSLTQQATLPQSE